jgi:hypothetical protein
MRRGAATCSKRPAFRVIMSGRPSPTPPLTPSMTAACADGLGTCCIGFAVDALNEPDIKVELGILADTKAIAPIIVGVPIGETFSPSRHSAHVLRWIR